MMCLSGVTTISDYVERSNPKISPAWIGLDILKHVKSEKATYLENQSVD